MAHVQCLIPVTCTHRWLQALALNADWKSYFLLSDGFLSGHKTFCANMEMINDSTIDY
ncbi:hypothetical protein Spb1_34460 [Planctopirus ephydatiae]|uniref:Uncharacterized protein n=1 Tax=Planctopirus ephydatiae TaxID=2528019 RepID=A0A518GSF2_9PLAN|nr:hypothetical protein Spb1_34460 [Planctopirus ephydatiae]